ncbi:MAG: molybdopterin-dependent oxidoreductase [Candidatus Thermoplasmatota archaeon]|nr:molybdopterin-dependent oxidoreductase [Candidatus Thermoplasmatota archaeon]MBU1940484.1 molybdopterin-dependent oxidoreductase [Candidatus Thermoplasmatota archaeon]
MNKKHLKLPLLIILIILTISLFSGCTNQKIELDGVEIREYQGERLNSINDFRENSIKGPQYLEKDNYTLTISGLATTPQYYSYDQLLTLFTSYTKVVILDCVEGWRVRILWDGILVKDIVQTAQPNQTANTVIFRAYDGYSTSLPLDYITENNILLAYKMNNITLPPERGFPFQLVAESKWGYKWIKWVTEIELTDDENYRGFWEQRGYSNSGNLNESFFEPK